jgi:hypothetical protein
MLKKKRKTSFENETRNVTGILLRPSSLTKMKVAYLTQKEMGCFNNTQINDFSAFIEMNVLMNMEKTR